MINDIVYIYLYGFDVYENNINMHVELKKQEVVKVMWIMLNVVVLFVLAVSMCATLRVHLCSIWWCTLENHWISLSLNILERRSLFRVMLSCAVQLPIFVLNQMPSSSSQLYFFIICFLLKVELILYLIWLIGNFFLFFLFW